MWVEPVTRRKSAVAGSIPAVPIKKGDSMKHLSIDIETRSSVDISKAGAYKYAESPDFSILLFAYKTDAAPVQVVDLASGEVIPEGIVSALSNPDITKHAYNAAFEWWCLNKAGYSTPLEQWQCTMAWALYCGYAAGLAATGEAIGLPDDKKKLAIGKALIKYFCTPQAPTKKNGGRIWNDPKDSPDKWGLFKTYNGQDVESEYSILQRLHLYPMPDEEWKQWRMDVRMNAYGVRVDTDLINGALTIDQISTDRLTDEAVNLTGLQNPNSAAQLLPWLAAHGLELPDLRKATVEEALTRDDLTDDVHRVLELRQQLGKTSIKKYVTMQTALGSGDRVRGIMQYYGANRTGRWAGRLVQMQNLPRNYIGTLDEARSLVKKANYEGLQMIYGNVPDTLSQLIRTAFIPSEGHKFVVADFSAIEARVIAWLAGETWVNEVFATHGKIYEATAAQMFHVPIESIAKGKENYSLRQKGKVATLALGYQGGPGALTAMGALKMGLSEDELPEIVDKWREANPHIQSMWYEIQDAAIDCVSSGRETETHGLIFRMEGDLIYGQSFMTIELPSGRKLFYPGAHLDMNKFGRPAIHYFAVGQQSRKWGVESTYGGKITENCLSGETIVITDAGLQRLKDTTIDMKLWDGDHWISHDGLICKNKSQTTIQVDGVRMTPDHKIYTKKGWRNANESKGLERDEVQWDFSAFESGIRWTSLNMELQVSLLREILRDELIRNKEAETKIMRLLQKLSYWIKAEKAWDVWHTNMERMAQHETALREPKSAGMVELRRERHTCVQSLVRELRGVLSGHGEQLPTRANPGQDRREWGLHTGELPLGDHENTGSKQEKQPVHKQPVGTDYHCGGNGKEWNRRDDAMLPTSSGDQWGYAVQSTGRTEPVFDIRNAGPKHCFYVMSNRGPLLVHNCVQAIARDCLAVTLDRIAKKGLQVVFHVHDEVIIDAPMETTVDELCDLMAEPIPWAPGLILKGAGFEGNYYKKD